MVPTPIYRTKQLLHLVLPPSSSSGKIAFRKLFLNYVHFTRYLQHILSMHKSRNVPLLCSGITSLSENKIPIKKFLFLNTLVTEICLFLSSQAVTIWRPGQELIIQKPKWSSKDMYKNSSHIIQCALHQIYFFRQITTFIKVQVAFVIGLQTL